MNDEGRQRDDHTVRDVTVGSVAGVAGVAFGFLVAGPVGAYGAAIAAPIVQGAGLRLVEWVRSRQAARVATVIELADARVSERLQAGDRPRHDQFLGLDAATDFAESVLSAAEREYEKKKLPLLAELTASVVFRDDIDGPTASLCLRTVERLSYRQLCALAAFGRSLGLDLMRHDYTGVVGHEGQGAGAWVVDESSQGMMIELLELAQLGLIRRLDDRPINSWADINPAQIRTEGIGHTIVTLALAGLDREAVEEMIQPMLADAFDGPDRDSVDDLA
jgi:hypothetical protein